jgi:hypothetical protein
MTTRKGSRSDTSAETELPPRRLTRELLRAFELAMMLANSRASEVVEISDLLAGLYIDNWERLVKFWPERGPIEAAMRRLCRISPQRWNYWIEYYDLLRREPEKKWKALGIPKIWPRRDKKEFFVAGRNFELSAELAAVLRMADGMAPYMDRVGTKLLPIVSSECILLAIAKGPRSEIGRRLLESGLDLTALEKAARFPRRAPI